MVMWSDDHAATWSPPRGIEKPSDDTGYHIGVSLTYLGHGKVIVCTQGRSCYCSEDFGRTWSDPAPRPPMSDGESWHQWDPYLVDKDPNTGEVIRLVETGYNCTDHDARAGAGYYAELRSSYDQGRTWDRPTRVPQWEGANEIALCRAVNDDIVAACRTENPPRFRNENDHYAGLAVSVSTDNGNTWSPLDTLHEWGRHHPSMVLVPNGDIVMTYVVRKGYPDTVDGFPQFGIEAVVSADHGRTWDLDRRRVLVSWTGNRKGDKGWWASCQCTSSVLLPGGSILTAYGTGYRSRSIDKALPAPRDVGLVEWRP